MSRTTALVARTLLIVAALSGLAHATWSIVIIDLRTKEIAIGSATCLTNFDLRRGSPVVVVGVGAAAAQSAIDTSGLNRMLIRSELLAGTPLPQILAMLAQQDGIHQLRQYGMVDATGDALAFTGSGAGPWAGHVTGRVGDLVYSIQGNVLTGMPVVSLTEVAVRSTPGDLADKLMAGMLVARALGGDGRCSCSTANPTGCGVPPMSFVKAAHIGYMIVARQGDVTGPCGAQTGCAAGSYYMNHDVAFQSPGSIDPVIQLQNLFNSWRAAHVGRPDHHLSTVSLGPRTLPADGLTTRTVVLTLRDWRNVPLASGGAAVTVSLDQSSAAAVAIGAVTDNGDGTYAFPVTAGTSPGVAQLRIEVTDAQGTVLLSPRTPVRLTGDALWASTEELSATFGGSVDFVLQGGAARAGRDWVLGARAAALSPLPPLLPPALVAPPFVATGTLDASGRSAVTLVALPGLALPYRGQTLGFGWSTRRPRDFASNRVLVHVQP